MAADSTRARIQRIRQGATRQAQQDLARLEGERQGHALRLAAAVQAMNVEASDEVALLALREACRLRYLPEVRRLEERAAEAEGRVAQQSGRVLDAWRQEKLAEELLLQEQTANRVAGLRREDGVLAEASAVRWWRERAA
jgi:hypothetical protein